MSAGFGKLTIGTDAGGLDGNTLGISVHSIESGSPLVIQGTDIGEEVGAVLEGEIEVQADDELYTLLAGQVIVIPAGLTRRYAAASAHARLYRVIVKHPVEVAP